MSDYKIFISSAVLLIALVGISNRVQQARSTVMSSGQSTVAPENVDPLQRSVDTSNTAPADVSAASSIATSTTQVPPPTVSPIKPPLVPTPAPVQTRHQYRVEHEEEFDD